MKQAGVVLALLVVASGCLGGIGSESGAVCDRGGVVFVEPVASVPENATVGEFDALADDEILRALIRSEETARSLDAAETGSVERSLQSIPESSPGLRYVRFRNATFEVRFACNG
jgi:hypothetical protein